jgi:outer membrane protein OmpA-like peptidoglycan-associated protein
MMRRSIASLVAVSGIACTLVACSAPPPVLEEARPNGIVDYGPYLVFFGWDSAGISGRGRLIIADFAKRYRRLAAPSSQPVELNGHTDATGSRSYNMKLGLLRAQAVANALVALGIPREALIVRSYGDTRPFVHTAHCVREPQNRRVDFIEHF